MKTFVTKSIGLAIGVALVAPMLMAPTAVNGSLGGFSANAQGGQNPGDWGIPQGSGQNSAGQSSQSSGGQNAAGQGKGPDAGGYGNGQNTQSGGGQNGPGEGQVKGAEGSGQNGNGQNSQSGSGQNGPGQQNSQSGDGQGEHANDGPTKNNSNNPDGDGSGQGEHANDGPTKNNSNNPDGDGGQNGNGSTEGDGPTKNNSNNPDGNSGSGSSGGNSSGSGSGSSSGSSGGGSGSGGDFPPLDPSGDGQYDPSDNGGDQQIPSGCAEAGSQCAQCVQRNEAIVQFNRRYLHVAWSTTNKTLDYTKQAIAFGDGVSGLSNTSLSWQLAGKPQILEAVQSLRRTYDAKYRIYINNMEQALDAMNQCEQDNFAVRDLYQRFSSLYLEFVKARYQSPD